MVDDNKATYENAGIIQGGDETYIYNKSKIFLFDLNMKISYTMKPVFG